MASPDLHLSFEERRKIAKWREGKMPVPEIADRLSRALSTIYRELKRNTYRDAELPQYSGYYAVTAQDKYERRRGVHRKLVAHPEVKAAVEDALKAVGLRNRLLAGCGLSSTASASAMKRSTASPIRSLASRKRSIATCPSIAGAAGRETTDDISVVTSRTARACVTGLRLLPSVRSSAIGSAI
jgi:hypothetical protein